MGMTIEQAMDKLLEFKKRTFKDDNVSELSQALSIAFLTMQNYQLLKNSYNDRLKADMVAMLKEIQLEIEEMSGLVTEIHGEKWEEKNMLDTQDLLLNIQEKIDKLKGVEE